MQLQETREERSIENYHKHAKAWDKHEQNVKYHFEQQLILKYGSAAEAQRVMDLKKGIRNKKQEKKEEKEESDEP
jgi:hypothetical protein